MMIGQTNATCDNGVEIVRLQENKCQLAIQVTAIVTGSTAIFYYTQMASMSTAMYGIKIGNTYQIIQKENVTNSFSSSSNMKPIATASRVYIKSLDVASLFNVGDKIRVYSNVAEGSMSYVNTVGVPAIGIVEGTIQSITNDIVELTDYTLTGMYGVVRSVGSQDIQPYYVVQGFEKL